MENNFIKRLNATLTRQKENQALVINTNTKPKAPQFISEDEPTPFTPMQLFNAGCSNASC